MAPPARRGWSGRNRSGRLSVGGGAGLCRGGTGDQQVEFVDLDSQARRRVAWVGQVGSAADGSAAAAVEFRELIYEANMTTTEVMAELARLGSEQTRKTYARHGAPDAAGQFVDDPFDGPRTAGLVAVHGAGDDQALAGFGGGE